MSQIDLFPIDSYEIRLKYGLNEGSISSRTGIDKNEALGIINSHVSKGIGIIPGVNQAKDNSTEMASFILQGTGEFTGGWMNQEIKIPKWLNTVTESTLGEIPLIGDVVNRLVTGILKGIWKDSGHAGTDYFISLRDENDKGLCTYSVTSYGAQQILQKYLEIANVERSNQLNYIVSGKKGWLSIHVPNEIFKTDSNLILSNLWPESDMNTKFKDIISFWGADTSETLLGTTAPVESGILENEPKINKETNNILTYFGLGIFALTLLKN